MSGLAGFNFPSREFPIAFMLSIASLGGKDSVPLFYYCRYNLYFFHPLFFESCSLSSIFLESPLNGGAVILIIFSFGIFGEPSFFYPLFLFKNFEDCPE